METLYALADTLLGRLAWTSAQATVLIAIGWLLGHLRPTWPAATRSLLWWLLGVQLILGLAVAAPVKLPLLSAAPSAVAVKSPFDRAPVSTVYANPSSWARLSSTGSHADAPTAAAPTPVTTGRKPWRLALLCLWLAGVLLQLTLIARDWRRARTVLRAAVPLRDPTLLALCAQQAQALGLRRQPALRVSPAIDSPQVAGLWRPTVLLPANHGLTAQESSLALAHELIHLRRGDLWLGWIPAIAQRLFFFHPLVGWAVREYALNREAACDAEVLQHTGSSLQTYGQLLLRLGVAHPMHAGVAGASPSFRNLKRRLIMLQQTDNPYRQRARSWLLIAAIALAGVVPYRVTASNANHAAAASIASYPSSMVQTAPPAPPAPPALPAPLPPPAPPSPPSPPPPRYTNGFSARHIDIDTSANAAYGFALMDGDSITINGSQADVDTLTQLRKGNEPILWFRRGSQSYVVRDRAYIQRAKIIYAPITALSTQQGTLGGEQGSLGGQQAGLGARQSALGAQQAALARQQARLASEQAAFAGQSADTRREAQFRAKQAALQAREDELGRQQEQLGRQQGVIGKQQGALGAKQAALAKQLEQAAAQANQRIGQLIDEAIAKGAAQTLGPGRA